MACPTTHGEWTFNMVNDKTPTQTVVLIFCLKVDNGIVTGTVSDKDGNHLSTDDRVTGVRQPVDQRSRDVMSLHFRWDTSSQAIRVFLAGAVFDDGLLKFEGRFLALAVSSQVGIVRPDGPDDGDTGTGTGTMT